MVQILPFGFGKYILLLSILDNLPDWNFFFFKYCHLLVFRHQLVLTYIHHHPR